MAFRGFLEEFLGRAPKGPPHGWGDTNEEGLRHAPQAAPARPAKTLNGYLGTSLAGAWRPGGPPLWFCPRPSPGCHAVPRFLKQRPPGTDLLNMCHFTL
jgi:hypothetical protein